MRCGLLGPKRVITRGYFMGFCYQASVGGSGDFYNTLFPAAWFPAPGLLGTRGYQWCFSFPALDMTILGTAVYFEGAG